MKALVLILCALMPWTAFSAAPDPLAIYEPAFSIIKLCEDIRAHAVQYSDCNDIKQRPAAWRVIKRANFDRQFSEYHVQLQVLRLSQPYAELVKYEGVSAAAHFEKQCSYGLYNRESIIALYPNLPGAQDLKNITGGNLNERIEYALRITQPD
jgi:hypothetical protein